MKADLAQLSCEVGLNPIVCEVPEYLNTVFLGDMCLHNVLCAIRSYQL